MSQWGHCEEFHTRVKPASLSNHLHFCFLPLMAELALIKSPSYLFCFFFHQSRLFLENRPLRMCELRSCLGGISPDQGGSQIEWCLISGQESGPSWQCQGGPTLGLWRARHGWREARTAVGSSQSDKMTAQAHENLSAPQEAVQSIAKAHQRLSGLVLRRRSKRAESLIAPNRQATASMSSLVMEERYQSFSRKSNSWVLANRALCSKSHAALM